MLNWFKSKNISHPREGGNDSRTKYRMLGLAIAAICVNVGFSAAHDPAFSMKQAIMLATLCIVTTYIIYRAVSMVEAVVRRRKAGE